MRNNDLASSSLRSDVRGIHGNCRGIRINAQRSMFPIGRPSPLRVTENPLHHVRRHAAVAHDRNASFQINQKRRGQAAIDYCFDLAIGSNRLHDALDQSRSHFHILEIGIHDIRPRSRGHAPVWWFAYLLLLNAIIQFCFSETVSRNDKCRNMRDKLNKETRLGHKSSIQILPTHPRMEHSGISPRPCLNQDK